jgi:hypothetical protein
VDVGSLSESLSGRVHELIDSGKREPILSTTGTRAAVDSLAARVEILEEAVLELTVAVQELMESR